MGKLSLILGGARSGKSTYAEKLAKEIGGDSVLYVATAETKDEEMRERIMKHRAARPAAWRTVEAPRGIAQAIRQERSGQRVILIDCITLLVSNLLLEGEETDDPFHPKKEASVDAEIDALLDFVSQTDADFLLVSNEVGMGLVPPYALGRAYRDILGRANQVLASHANEVCLLVAGIPMKVK